MRSDMVTKQAIGFKFFYLYFLATGCFRMFMLTVFLTLLNSVINTSSSGVFSVFSLVKISMISLISSLSLKILLKFFGV